MRTAKRKKFTTIQQLKDWRTQTSNDGFTSVSDIGSKLDVGVPYHAKISGCLGVEIRDSENPDLKITVPQYEVKVLHKGKVITQPVLCDDEIGSEKSMNEPCVVESFINDQPGNSKGRKLNRFMIGIVPVLPAEIASYAPQLQGVV